MKNPRRITNYVTAIVLAAGVAAIGFFGRSIVGADVILPGYATAHIHLEITVCESSQVPVKAVFTPTSGKKYYFKERTFEVSPGLNTIEWYIRKIPGGEFTANLTSSDGIFDPSSLDTTLTNEEVGDVGTYSLVICEPTTNLVTATPASDEPTGDISSTESSSSTSSSSSSSSSSASASATQTVPSVPVPSSSGEDELSSPI